MSIEATAPKFVAKAQVVLLAIAGACFVAMGATTLRVVLPMGAPALPDHIAATIVIFAFAVFFICSIAHIVLYVKYGE